MTTQRQKREPGTPVSFRLSTDEQEALTRHPVRCPTCRQPVTNLNTLARMALRRLIGLDADERADENEA